MFGFIRKSFANKIMTAVIISMMLVMTAEIALRIYFGTKDRLALLTTLNKDMANSIFSGIKYPMSVGNSEAVMKVLSAIKVRQEKIEVWFCDFNQNITWSTRKKKMGTNIGNSLHNKDILKALNKALVSGIAPKRSFESELDRKKILVTIRPILNHRDCYHCHGSSRKVLGNMVIGAYMQHTYETVAAARNRTLVISFIGISLIIALIYTMVTRFLQRPVRDLVEASKRFAEGDMAVSVEVKTEDEIGVLGNTFNYMVQRISSFSKALEQEVAKKTSLLDERTKLIGLLEKANIQLKELDKLKSMFLANMSHELRTPMNSIIGYSDLLIDGVDGPINEEQKKSLGKISNNAKHLLQLLNDLLDVSKIEAGKVKLEPEELDFRELVDHVLPIFEPMLKKKNLSINIDIAEDLPPVYCDKDKMKHVLMNLVSNAIKFTHKGGITIRAKISDRGIRPGESPIFAEVSVEDTGIGIKDEDLGKIFDKFVQADLSIVRQYEGTGLGLSIARGLVALHKGMIWATSEYGKGSQFHFTIPLRKEILERPAKPVLELHMADALAEHFGVPVETFLREPQYAGKKIACHEYLHCEQPSCPAYGAEDKRCWLILGTHCAGQKIGAYPEKVNCCKNCELIQKLVLESQAPDTIELGVSIEEDTSEDASRKTVLAIDNDEDSIDIIRKSLGKNYRVVGLFSGEGAVEKAKEIKPIAITLDIMMPRKDGWQVLRELKSTPETQDIPVIILSIVDDKKLGFSLGAAEYMVKPLNKDVLLRRLKSLGAPHKIHRVLIVDNEKETVNLVKHTLEEIGYQIETAYCSNDAIDLIKTFKPDLIVLNLTMPKVSGFDVIEYIKTEDKAKNIPLILITGKELTKEEIDQLDGRIEGIFNKGVINREEVLQEIRDRISHINAK